MTYVVVDIETTGFNPRIHEIIEVGAVRVVNGTPTETFQTLIKPTGAIPEEIYRITGISDDMVADAPLVDTVIPKLLQFIGDDTIVAHNLDFDLPFIQQKCEDMGLTLLTSDGICTLILSRVLQPTVSTHRLERLAGHFDIDVPTSHRALADAQTTAHLLRRLEEEAQRLPVLLLQQLGQLSGLFSQAMASWFAEQTSTLPMEQQEKIPDTIELKEGLMYSARSADTVPPSEPSQEERMSPPSSDLADDAVRILRADGPLSHILQGYEPRAGQVEMVARVSEAFRDGKHAVIEAGTGTGKSMAYLIPAALYALSTGSRVVVSTHTMALQDQIEKRDFPTLQSVFDGELNLAIQKGRKNYVCLRKVKTEASLMTFASQTEEIVGLMSMLTWLIHTTEGVREELSTAVVKGTLWSRVQSETDTCINKRCPFFRPCYYFRAKSRAQVADIVVTNHSLLMSDIKADHRVLPKYDTLVIDEAHHLEEQATKHLGGEVHASQLGALAYRLSRDKGKNGVLPELLSRFQSSQSLPFAMEERLNKALEWVDEIGRSADVAFHLIGSLVPAGKSEIRLTDEILKQSEFVKFTDQMAALRPPIQSLRELVKALHEWSKQADTDEDAGRIVDAGGFLDQWLQGVEMLEEMTVPAPDRVSWIERRGAGRPRISVHTAPIDVSHTLRHMLFEPLERVILTSATMSVKGSFDYAVAQLGLQPFREEDQLITANVPSPFHYASQARLCVPSDVPELAKMPTEESSLLLARSLYQLALASQGRLLALFTSHQMLRETAKILRSPLGDKDLALFAQDVDGSRSAMLEAFRKNPRSVLLGAQSFWEGIDLPGDQLTTLVIVRLPFAPPSHPVTEARHERLQEQGKSPFWVASLPEAVVRFRQGFGRLIRTRQDKGVVVVYDKRIITQRYGQTFIQSLAGVKPYIAPEREVLAHVRTFLAQSTAKAQV